MSIRHGLLALLNQGPRYGYQLRSEFEARTGATWPLNVGQVYTTLGRLERDGLVEPAGEDGEGHVFYAITETGRAEMRSWFGTPVRRDSPPRDELAIKLAMAVTVPGVDVREVVQAQRRHSIQALQDYTRLKARALTGESAGGGDGGDLAWLLVLEQLIFQTEAEVRWLDHCETLLTRLRPVPAAPEPTGGTEREPQGSTRRRGTRSGRT
ncbi:PadR family transcriptional regulator [Peterkaempfera bronchialis]|uniref:PadR family transcriptional regulator n=1 Tax=Peterkaempfera bronchialis TaxID=2126346 RepID=UPI003C30446D